MINYPEEFPIDAIRALVTEFNNENKDFSNIALCVWNIQGYVQSKALPKLGVWSGNKFIGIDPRETDLADMVQVCTMLQSSVQSDDSLIITKENIEAIPPSVWLAIAKKLAELLFKYLDKK